MSTTLPRVNVVFDRPTYALLEDASKVRRVSLSGLVAGMVKTALELSEDLALAERARERLKTFRRGEALSSARLLVWNKSRKNPRA